MVSAHLRKIRHFGGHFFQSLREHVDPNYQVWEKCIIIFIWHSVTSRNTAAWHAWHDCTCAHGIAIRGFGTGWSATTYRILVFLPPGIFDKIQQLTD